jgi:ubiquinone/menaquinone biosynthesis C-methylase UbiE
VPDEPNFAPACRALRGEVIEYYRDRGEAIDDDAGLRTLATNSTLVPQRARLLMELLARRRGENSIEGLKLADLGCGFGAMSLYFATAGARVTGMDPNEGRFQVGARVARSLGLDATFKRGWVEEMPLDDADFDLVVLNNSLCYLTDRSDRRRALEHVLRICRPGARLAMRNPSLASPIDPFTGLPLVHQLPAPLARPILKLTPRGRSRSTVRMMSAAAAKRELRRAGFEEVRFERDSSERRPARYQHLTARRPPAADESAQSA